MPVRLAPKAVEEPLSTSPELVPVGGIREHKEETRAETPETKCPAFALHSFQCFQSRSRLLFRRAVTADMLVDDETLQASRVQDFEIAVEDVLARLLRALRHAWNLQSVVGIEEEKVTLLYCP